MFPHINSWKKSFLSLDGFDHPASFVLLTLVILPNKR